MSNNGYPFTSRRQILERIATEPPFALECVSIIEERKGWMASHRARAAKVVATLAVGAPTAADYTAASELAARYGKTLARVFRERELAARPELGTEAAVFGVVAPRVAAAPSEATTPQTEPVSKDGTDATNVSAAPKKRGGRPKGSKNKVRSASEPKRRKRS